MARALLGARSSSTSPSRGCRSPAAARRSRFDLEDLAQRVTRDEVEYWVGLPGDGAETEVFFSDLGHEYITINADYTT